MPGQHLSEEAQRVTAEHLRGVFLAPAAREQRRREHPQRLDALESVEYLSGASTRVELAQRLADSVREEFAADWAVVLRGDTALATSGGRVPDPSVLEALAAGTAASPSVAAGDSGPDDLAVAPFPAGDVFLLVGRDGHPFRRRERRQLLVLARIADRVGTIMSG